MRGEHREHLLAEFAREKSVLDAQLAWADNMQNVANRALGQLLQPRLQAPLEASHPPRIQTSHSLTIVFIPNPDPDPELNPNDNPRQP